MQSANATHWFEKLPPVLARVFADRSAKSQPVKVSKAGAPVTGNAPEQFSNINEIATGAGSFARRPEIMAPLDFSPESLLAADYAIEIARCSQARLILLHAVHLNLTPYGPVNPRWLRAALCREALEKMEATMVRAQSAGVPVISVIEEGPPAKVISEAAKRWKTDLIILASQKRGKWARLWSQRIREKVARRAACPVVVMRTQSKKGTMT